MTDHEVGWVSVDIGSCRVIARARYAGPLPSSVEWSFTAYVWKGGSPDADGEGFQSSEEALRVGIDALRLAREMHRERQLEWDATA